MMGCCLIATFTCQTLSKNSIGSGVPQVKTILSGVKIYKFLQMRVFIAKYIGILFTGMSGVGTGKEGPLIHMSAMIGFNLAKYHLFENIGKVKTNPFPFSLPLFPY